MRAMESTRRKLYASEEKCSWSQVLLKWWCVIRSKFTRSTSSEAGSPKAEVHQKMRDLKLQRLFKGFNHAQHCRRLEVESNG